MVYTEEQREFLAGHTWAVLATGRSDGSPQQAMVGYTMDAEGRIVLSTPRTTAKWKNAERLARVSLTVPDGRVNVVVYGTAQPIVDDPERAELTADFLAAVRGGDRPDPDSLRQWLDEEDRGVLLVTPEKVLMHR